jgi:HEPN domain-containing protein
MKKEVKNWLDSACYDLETAEHMLNTGRYIYTIFMCHLAIEKILKAKVQEISGKIPPRTHDLIYLLKLSELKPDDAMKDFIGELNGVSVPTRYPEDFVETQRRFTTQIALNYLTKTKEAFTWIQGFIK